MLPSYLNYSSKLREILIEAILLSDNLISHQISPVVICNSPPLLCRPPLEQSKQKPLLVISTPSPFPLQRATTPALSLLSLQFKCYQELKMANKPKHIKQQQAHKHPIQCTNEKSPSLRTIFGTICCYCLIFALKRLQ